jgi:ATP-binding cassette subfamily C protein LapB
VNAATLEAISGPAAVTGEKLVLKAGPIGEDMLFRCLQRAAVLFERPMSEAILTAGLPYGEDGFTQDLFARAAEKIQIGVTWIRRPASELIGADAPAVAWRSDGRPLLIEQLRDGGSVEAYLPEVHRSVSLSSLADLAIQDSLASLRPGTSRLMPQDAQIAPPHWFWGSLLRFWRTHGYILLATVIINLLALITPLFTMNVYDRVLPNKAFTTLWVLAAGVSIGLAFDFLLRVVRSNLIDHVTRRLDLGISSTMMERVLNSRFASRAATTGAMTQRLNEYDFVRDFFASSTIVFLIDICFAVVFIAVIAWIAWPLAFVPVVVLGVMVGVGLLIQKLMGNELARARYTQAQRHSLMVEMLAGLETIKSVGAEGPLLRKWDMISREASFSTERIKSLSSYAVTIAYAMQFLATISIIIIGAYLFDLSMITVGGIIACSMLAGRAVGPAGQLAISLTRVRQAFSALDSLDSVMTLPDERVDQRLLVAREVKAGHIEFRGVGFSYDPEGRRILEDVNLAIKPGERVAILGRVGVGKTTLGRLLIRLYDISAGDILIDGVDIRQYHPHILRQEINFIGQEADLFHGSLRENLLLARPDSTDSQLVEAARLAGVDEFAARHPQGYALPVGERGGLLSSGQRHMVALARAFLRRGKVLFLDDPTSSMDMATERLFVARLQASLAPQTTLVVTTHRNAVLSLVDRVVVIEGGRVVADGPRDAVLQRLATIASAAPG